MVTIENLSDSNQTPKKEKLNALKEILPNCFDKNGEFIRENFDEILNTNGVNFSKESYSLNWLGKSYARLLANEKPLSVISEDESFNKNKNSQNLLIKGDNLEVLKHLKNAYYKSIKMIYIDPPYNTGSDFIYKDDRKFSADELSQKAGIEQGAAKRILEFTQKGSNSHSAWLTFIYPRLYIARHLLRDDGVIFISIDDNEQAQLKLLCDEIFGEENFVSCVVWNSISSVLKQSKFIRKEHEYIIVYAKDKQKLTFNRLENGMIFENPDNDPNGAWFSSNAASPNQNKDKNYFGINLPNGRQCFRSWKFSEDDYIQGKVALYLKDGNVPRLKIYEKDYDKNTTIPSSIFSNLGSITTAKTELEKIFKCNNLFDTPKPQKLLQKIIQISTNGGGGSEPTPISFLTSLQVQAQPPTPY